MRSPKFSLTQVKELDPEAQVMLDVFILEHSVVDFSAHDLRDYRPPQIERTMRHLVFEDPRCQDNWSHNEDCSCVQFDDDRWKFVWR